MPGVDPLVAIDAAQLVDPLDAAHQQPLQVQLQGDSQVEVDIQGVVMGRKRPGGRPAGDRVQRRPFDLDEPAAGQRVADRLHDLRPPQKPLQHAVGVDQVEIAHPLPQLGIGQALVLFRRRGNRLGQELQVLGEDRQLALHGPLQLAVDADDVAQIEALGQGEVLLAHLVLADHHLDRAGPVADLQPVDLARGAAEHDSAGGPDLRAVLLGRVAGLAGAARW